MDKKIIQEKVSELFNQRISEASQFWNSLEEDKMIKLYGTTKILDGDPAFLESLVKNGNRDNDILFNLYKHYENNIKKRNYYKSGMGKRVVEQLESKKPSKRIAIFLPHATWTGGMKMIFNLGDLLINKGYKVDYYIAYNNTEEKMILDIGPITREVITYESDEKISNFSAKYDLAIATHWDLIFPLFIHFNKALFYAQGDYDTFSNQQEKISLLTYFYSLPVHHMGVSSFISHLMSNNYHRKSWIVPCGVNLSTFKYRPEVTKEDYILVFGDGANVYKNTINTIDNLIPLADKLDIKIKWITPNKSDYTNNRVEIITDPEQSLLIETVQKAKVIVNGSLIESFSLPPLESMACGTPVVSSNNMGILQYASHNKNALLFPYKDYELMREHVMTIFSNKEIEQKLIKEGLETAKDYDEDSINELNFELIKNEFLTPHFIKPISLV